MSRVHSLWLGLFIAALAAGIWFALGDRAAEPRDGLSGAPAAGEASPRRPSAVPLEAAEVIEPVVSESERRAAVVEAEAGLPRESFAADGAPTFEVALAIPPGSPADDSLAVLALYARPGVPLEQDAAALQDGMAGVHAFVEGLRSGTGRTDGRKGPAGGGERIWAWRAFDGAGSVELPYPTRAGEALVVLDGAFLYLTRPKRVDLGNERRVVLEPELGARLLGDVVLPPGASAWGVERANVEGAIQLWGGSFEGPAPRFRSEHALLDDGGRYELRALFTDASYTLQAQVKGLGLVVEQEIELAPGEDRTLDLRVPLGGRVRGRVVGADGTPVAGAEVRAETESQAWGGPLFEPETTDEDGAYHLTGLEPGESRVGAQAAGWLPGGSKSFVVRDGRELEGIEVVLERGHHVAGRVTWPDGSPAVGASVEARELSGFGLSNVATTSTEGVFRITGLGGLGDSPLTLESWALRAADGERAVGAGDTPLKWSAFREHVAPDTDDLILVLEPGGALAGFVRDTEGAPIPAFTLSIAPAGDRPRMQRTDMRRFEDDDGAFLVTDLGPGEWELAAHAEGFIDMEEPVRVTLPREGEPVVLVLERSARIEGLVVDPNGTPISGATVTPNPESYGMGGVFLDYQENPTDREGRFAIEGVPPGTHSLSAEAEGWAASEPVTVELAAGERLAGVELRLRVGGRVAGEVVDEAGEPLAGLEVTIGETFSPFGWSDTSTETDSAGRFAFDGVTPGKWVVTAGASREAIEALDSEQEMIELVSQLITENVVVVDGEETFVRLQAAGKRPVHVLGRVTLGGAPFGDRPLYALAEGGSLMEGMKTAGIGPDGRFELTLDRPGAYLFALDAAESNGPPSLEFPIDVPDVREHAVELRIPAGRIEGTVFGPDGERARGVFVSLSRAGAVATLAVFGGGAWSTTDADGRYAFEHLWPGTYTVRAGGEGLFFFGASGDAPAVAVQGGLRVDADATLSGVDFHLSAAGSVSGIVRDAKGEPVAGVSIFVRDARGELLSTLSSATTGAGGEFTYEHVAPGKVTVLARGEGTASREEPAVQVRAGERAAVELRVQPAATLVVTTTDGEGAPLRARISVRDGLGHEVAGLRSESSQLTAFNAGISSTVHRVGPLPPGGYDVLVTAFDGRTASRTVALEAGVERELAIAVGD